MDAGRRGVEASKRRSIAGRAGMHGRRGMDEASQGARAYMLGGRVNHARRTHARVACSRRGRFADVRACVRATTAREPCILSWPARRHRPRCVSLHTRAHAHHTPALSPTAPRVRPALRSIILHYTASRCIPLHYTASRCVPLPPASDLPATGDSAFVSQRARSEPASSPPSPQSSSPIVFTHRHPDRRRCRPPRA